MSALQRRIVYLAERLRSELGTLSGVTVRDPGIERCGIVTFTLDGHSTLVAYLVAIPLTLLNRDIGLALYALVALMWLVPDRRIESRLNTQTRRH